MTALSSFVVATPVGDLAAVLDGDVVIASGFSGLDDQAKRLGLDAVPPQRDSAVADAVRRYFAGDVDALDDVGVRQPGGAFRQDVWTAMRRIPAGTTLSYGELAVASGHPTAVRAVGTACATNIVAPFVPCHRVTRAGGAVGNYYYGPEVKRWLLTHESAALFSLV